MLQPDKKKQLDKNIRTMLDNGSSQEEVMSYASDFKTKFGVKKKDSTAQNQKLVSDQEAENGLSGTPQDEPIKLPGNKDYTERNEVYKDNTAVNIIKPKYTTLSEAPIYEQKPLTEKEQIQARIRKQHIDEARIGFKEAVTFTDDDKKEVEQRIKDEETIGFWDDFKKGFISSANIIKQIGTLGFGDTIENPTKIPFQSEIKEVKKQALKNKEKLEESEIKERAKNLYKEKQEDFIYTDKATKFLEDLPTEIKSVLKIESSNVIDNLSSDNKKRMQVNSALEIILKENTTELKRLEQDFRNNPDFTQEDVDNYNKLRETTINTANHINKNYEHLIKNQEDLLTAEKEYDLFKRNYDSVFLTNTLLTTADLGVGMVDFGNYLANTASEINPLNKSIISGLGGNPENLIDTKEIRDDLKAERELIRKPTESVESVNGLGNYMSDLVANQLAVLAVTSTGAGGLVVLGSSSTGQKYAEMSDEKNSTKTPANYTPLQMIGAPLLHGTAEAIFELPTLSILKKGKRVLNATLKETPGLFKQSAKAKAQDLFKDFLKENLAEQGTNIIQNAINIYGLGKEGHITDNALDILKDTSALTGMLQVTPHLTGAMLKPFQSKDQLKTLEVNAAKMLALSKQLETPNITDTEKNVIESQLKELTTESSKIMNKTIGDVTNMPEELHKEVLKINAEAGLLRKQAEDIYINGTTPNKEALIKSINDKYTALQDKRTAIVNGETTIVDTLPLEQQDKLKREALKELTQEQNPDGKKNITIDDAQITERANNIYLNNKDAKSKKDTTETKEQAVETATPETQVESKKGIADIPSPVVELNPNNTNETQTKGDTATDANIQPGVETGNKQGQDKSTQPTVDTRASDTKTEIEKEYSVNDSEKAPKYKVTFKEGVLDVKDSKGKTPSPPTRRKILDKYANDFDFTNGEKSTTLTEAIDPVEHIAATSNNPAEIAETILNTDTKAYLEDNLDYSERIIAENIGKIDRESFINFGDKNYINNNLARAYLKKGGAPIDTFIEELNEDFGTNLTEQDVIDFIVKNPNGPEDAYRAIRRDKIDPLKTAFTNKTGLPANAKFLNKAIKQQLAKNENFSVVDVFNDEQLISLLNEREQAEQETYTARANPSTREGSGQDENRPGVREESESDEREQESKTNLPNGSSQGELGSSNETDSRMAEVRHFIGRSVEKAKGAGAITLHEQQDLEAQAAIDYSEKAGNWIDNVNSLGEPFSSGHENNNYLDIKEKQVYKANNLINSRTISALFDSTTIHNNLFPETAYEFVGFTGNKNRLTSIQPVFRQKLVHDTTKAQPSEIKTYMESLGFEQKTPESYTNGDYLVSDLYPRNVLKDEKGNMYVVDAELKALTESDKKKLKDSSENDNEQANDETQAQGISFSKENNRDSSLSKEGPVKAKNARQRKFKRFWNNTFSSKRGLDSKVIRTIESLSGELAAINTSLEYEASQFAKLSKHIKNKGAKNYNEHLKTINNYLSGETTVDISFLTDTQKSELDAFRGRIDTLSDKITDIIREKKKGIKNEASLKRLDALIETIEGNKGRYMFRQYDAFSNNKLLDDLTSKHPNIAGKKRLKKAIEFVSEDQNISIEDAEAQVLDYLDSLKGSNSFVSASSTGKAKAPFLKKRKDIPEPIRELLGESKDPVKNYIATVMNMSTYIANLEYQSKLTDVLSKLGLVSDKMKPGYTKLAKGQEGWDLLQDTYVPVETAEGIEDMQPLKGVQDSFYKTLIQLSAYTKIGKTVLAPQTTSRNFLSGIYLSFNNGFNPFLNPKKFALGLAHSWGTKKTNTELKHENQRLIKLGIIKDGAVSREVMGILNDAKLPIDQILEKNTLDKFLEVMQKMYAAGDDAYKAVGFYVWEDRYKRAGFDNAQAEDLAAERIRNGFPTYSKIPKNIQKLRRIPLIGTFPSFTYEVWRTNFNNVKFIGEDIKASLDKNKTKKERRVRAEMAAHQISGMAIATATAYALSELSKSLVGISDDEDETTRNMSAPWQKDSKNIYIGKQGSNYEVVDATAFFPQETILKPIRILIEDREGRDINTKISLSLKSATDAFFGTDIFMKSVEDLHVNKNGYGQPIYKGENILEGIANDPDKVSNYILRQVGPGLYNNIAEFARANEIAPNFFGEKETSYKEYTNTEALLALVGIRLSRINYVNGINSIAYDTKDKYQYIRRDIFKDIKSTRDLSVEDIKTLNDDYIKENNEIHKEVILAVRGAKKQGIPKEKIDAALKGAGYSATDIKYISKGETPLLKPISSTTIKNKKNMLDIGRFSNDPEKLKSIKINIDDKANTLNEFIKAYNKTRKAEFKNN